MLINLTPNLKEIERRFQVSKEHNFNYTPQNDSKLNIETGIYICNFGFNFSYDEFLECKDGNIPYKQSYDTFAPTYHKSQYGVADSLEQIKEYFKEEIEDLNRNFIITIAGVYQDKDNKGKGGGWRWHKWGEYIGKLNPQCEYLDDEDFGDDFECVICFHLYEIK